MSITSSFPAKPRTLSLAEVMRRTEDEAFKMFTAIRWADTPASRFARSAAA